MVVLDETVGRPVGDVDPKVVVETARGGTAGRRLGERLAPACALLVARLAIQILIRGAAVPLETAGIKVRDSNEEAIIKRLSDVISKRRRQWEGNVRQLEAEVKRLVLMSGGSLQEMLKVASRAALTEREELELILRQTGWNKSRAARLLGLSEGTIRYRIQKYELSNIEES